MDKSKDSGDRYSGSVGLLDTVSTVLDLANFRKGSYPKILEDASSVLVSQNPRMVPAGFDLMALSGLEAMVRAESDSYARAVYVTDVHEAIAEHNASIPVMVNGLLNFGHDGYVTAFAYSQGSVGSAITIPRGTSRFQFEIMPYTFNLGRTGRRMTDGDNVFDEELLVKCDVYDAYDLALQMRPEVIVARMNNGSLKNLSSSDKSLEWVNINEVGDDERKVFLIDRFAEKGIGIKETSPLHSSLELVADSMFEKISSRYGHRAARIFGYNADNFRNFLVEAGKSPYLFWKINQMDRGSDLNSSVSPCGFMGSDHKFPEQQKRAVFCPNKAYVSFGSVMLEYGSEAAHVSLMGLGDLVTDLWVDPQLTDRQVRHETAKSVLRERNIESTGDFGSDVSLLRSLGVSPETFEKKLPLFDIVYDRRDGIGPDHPVQVRDEAGVLKYMVDRK